MKIFQCIILKYSLFKTPDCWQPFFRLCREVALQPQLTYSNFRLIQIKFTLTFFYFFGFYNWIKVFFRHFSMHHFKILSVWNSWLLTALLSIMSRSGITTTVDLLQYQTSPQKNYLNPFFIFLSFITSNFVWKVFNVSF